MPSIEQLEQQAENHARQAKAINDEIARKKKDDNCKKIDEFEKEIEILKLKNENLGTTEPLREDLTGDIDPLVKVDLKTFLPVKEEEEVAKPTPESEKAVTSKANKLGTKVSSGTSTKQAAKIAEAEKKGKTWDFGTSWI
tara:strand:- start:1152 stop:1571 length:420 start_codon:yes stop_codon:yes gene_type:complete